MVAPYYWRTGRARRIQPATTQWNRAGSDKIAIANYLQETYAVGREKLIY